MSQWKGVYIGLVVIHLRYSEMILLRFYEYSDLDIWLSVSAYSKYHPTNISLISLNHSMSQWMSQWYSDSTFGLVVSGMIH